MAVTARQVKIGRAIAGSLLAAVIAGLLIGVFLLHLSLAVAGPLAAIVLAGAFIAALPHWRMLDHMQRDSRLLSWYWGGGFGGGLGLVLALMLAGARSPVFAGAALVWTLQLAGYAAWRLGWWLAHRSAPT